MAQTTRALLLAVVAVMFMASCAQGARVLKGEKVAIVGRPGYVAPRVVAPVYRPGVGSVTTVRPTLNPLTGPRVTTTSVGPYGGVTRTSAVTRATPLLPGVGPVTTVRTNYVGK